MESLSPTRKWILALIMVTFEVLFGLALYSSVWVMGKIVYWTGIVDSYPDWGGNNVLCFILFWGAFSIWSDIRKSHKTI